jgi:choline dehydrogenase-like flavoprotein
LRSADPADPVRIDQNFLAVGSDVETLRTGLKLLREVAAQSALDPVRGREIKPGKDVQSDADLDAYIRSAPATAHYPCGTCRMGSDEDAVVDGDLRVRGMDGLRVADASIMPDLVGGNINATVIMIAGCPALVERTLAAAV